MLDAVRGVLLSGKCDVGVNPLEEKERSVVEDARDGEFPCVQMKVLSASSDIPLDGARKVPGGCRRSPGISQDHFACLVHMKGGGDKRDALPSLSKGGERLNLIPARLQ